MNMKRIFLLSLLATMIHLAGVAQTRYFVCTIESVSTVENFIIAASDEALLEMADAQLLLPVDQRSKFISGGLAPGNGGFNAPWSWHIPENEWSLVDNSIELCDGRPSDIENNLSYWLDTVKSFCPWGSYIEREIPLASATSPSTENASMLVYNGSGAFTFNTTSVSAELSLYNTTGQRVLYIPHAYPGMQVYTPSLIRGVYVAVIRDQQALYHQKMMILP